MGLLIGVILAVLFTTAGVFYLGARYGVATEQEIVARILAEYRKVSKETETLVYTLLDRLGADYKKAYTAVVDKVDQVEIALKKVL